MTSVKWLLVGAGDIATKRVAPALIEAENSEIIAICDIEEGNAAKLAGRSSVKTVFTDLDKALAESGADAVYIATPQHTHIKLSLKVLDAGKHFLCEKPLGLNGAECMRLLEAVRKSDRITSCSNYRRLSEQYKLTEAMVKGGEIGKLVGGWAIYSAGFYHPGNTPMRKEFGVSRIKELGFYLIDIAQNILGMPTDAMAQASTLDKAARNDVEDIASVILRFPGGGLFTIIFNSNSPSSRHELEFFGTKGRIYWQKWPPHGNGPVYKITKGRTEELEAHTTENWHLPMIRDYVDAVLTGRQPICTIESAVRTEIITDAIFRSIDSGKVEPVLWEQ